MLRERLRRGVIAGSLLLVVTLGGVAAWSRSAPYLLTARWGLILIAALLYCTGFMAFALVWSWLSGLSCTPREERPGRQLSSIAARFRVGLLSLAGLLTPFNVGSDILRSTLGRHYLGLDYVPTAAASLVTRECKLHVSLALLAVAATAGAGIEADHARLPFALLGLTALAVALAAFRSKAAARLTLALGVGRLADTARLVSRQMGWRRRATIYGLFAACLAAEWEALRLCCQSLGIAADVRTTLAGYAVLHFASRASGVPLGIGIVELSGFAWFRVGQTSVERAGAIVVLWGCLRVAVPYLLAALGFATLVVGRSQRQEGACGTAGPANVASLATISKNVSR